MAQRQIVYPFFFVSLFFALTGAFPLIAFAPFIALVCTRYSHLGALWAAAGCGLVLDLLGAAPFGIYAMSFTLATLIIFRYQVFFQDTPMGLATLTSLFSLLVSIAIKLSFFAFGIALPLTFKGFLTDFLIMPLFDGVYSLICFSFPLILYKVGRRYWFRFLFFRKELKTKEEEVKTHAK